MEEKEITEKSLLVEPSVEEKTDKENITETVEEPAVITGEAVEATETDLANKEELAKQKSVEPESERNFRELREKVKRIERERDEATSILRQIEQSALQQQSAQQVPPKDDVSSYSDDDLLEGRHLKQEVNSIRKKMEEYQRKVNEQTVEMQLKAQFPDFEKVMTYENVTEIRRVDPEMAQSLYANPDLKSQAIATYKQIKRLGIAKEDNYSPDRDRANRNSSKPRASVSLSPQEGDSPLSRANAFANGLTPELKEQLYKEMKQKARGM